MLDQHNIELIITPSGETSTCAPLDVGVNGIITWAIRKQRVNLFEDRYNQRVDDSNLKGPKKKVKKASLARAVSSGLTAFASLSSHAVKASWDKAMQIEQKRSQPNPTTDDMAEE